MRVPRLSAFSCYLLTRVRVPSFGGACLLFFVDGHAGSTVFGLRPLLFAGRRAGFKVATAGCFQPMMDVLATSGCCWLLLAAAGCSWLLLAAPGCCWLLLAAAGCCWFLLAACCCWMFWLLLAAAGCCWMFWLLLLLVVPACSRLLLATADGCYWLLAAPDCCWLLLAAAVQD